jgi:hypothetical protein
MHDVTFRQNVTRRLMTSLHDRHKKKRKEELWHERSSEPCQLIKNRKSGAMPESVTIPCGESWRESHFQEARCRVL